MSEFISLGAAALKREQDALGKKLKTLEAAVKGVEKEMDDFQKEKQGALNQIDVALTLSLHQVHLPRVHVSFFLLPSPKVPRSCVSLFFNHLLLTR